MQARADGDHNPLSGNSHSLPQPFSLSGLPCGAVELEAAVSALPRGPQVQKITRVQHPYAPDWPFAAAVAGKLQDNAQPRRGKGRLG